MSTLPLWFQKLTPELEKYAEETIGETAEIRSNALSEFRVLIEGKKNLNCRNDDTFLLGFLRHKKFDVHKAFKVLNNYYTLQAKYKDVFTGKMPSEVRKIGDMKAIVCLPYRLPPGSHINVLKIGNVDLSQASAVDFIAFQLVFAELILMCEATQVCGGVNIVDFRDSTLRHYTQFLSTAYISLVITILQDCWPERIKAVHFLFEPTAFRVIYRIFSPVLKTKFKERLHFHGDDLNSLHQHVPRDYLPEELGGNMGPLDNTEFLSYFLSQEAFISRIHTFGLLEKI